ncbi:MAG: DsbA family protein [Patescibacteria group bacterium]
MKISFYFDPVCPWCWMTSRWIKQVEKERNLEVSWEPISLLLKNGAEGPYGEYYKRTAEMLDVVEAVKEAGEIDKVDTLYTAFGLSVHKRRSIAADDYDAGEIITACLKEAGLDSKYASAAGQDKYRKLVEESTNKGLEIVGDDVGTPIISLLSAQGSEIGLFGPVISELPPTTEEAVQLWDAYITFADKPYFWELKRTRDVGANVESTF